MSTKKNGKFSKPAAADSARKKLKTAIVVCSILLIVLLALLLLLGNRDAQNAAATKPTETVPDASDFSQSASSVPQESEAETTMPTVTQNQTETTELTEPVDTKATEQTTTPQTEPDNTKPENDPKPTQPPATQPPATQPPATQPPKVVINLPYTIPGTTLTIQRVAGYDGIYLEDGSKTSVTGVAMMMLTNSGNQAVEYARITLTYDDTVLTFEVSALRAGGVIAVQEAGRNPCAVGDLIQCNADVAVLDSLDMASDKIQVKDNGDNTLTVTNLTDKEITTVRLFYKYYMPEQQAYVGGITFTAKISGLGPNASIVINPSHYISGGCEVVMVRTYNTEA